MKTTRIRLLVAGGILAASAILAAPAALAQPLPCPTDPANPSSGACASSDSMYGPISGPDPGIPPNSLPGPVQGGILPGNPGSDLP